MQGQRDIFGFQQLLKLFDTFLALLISLGLLLDAVVELRKFLLHGNDCFIALIKS